MYFIFGFYFIHIVSVFTVLYCIALYCLQVDKLKKLYEKKNIYIITARGRIYIIYK